MNTKAAWILGLSIALTPAAWATAAQGVDSTQAAVPADDALRRRRSTSSSTA